VVGVIALSFLRYFDAVGWVTGRCVAKTCSSFPPRFSVGRLQTDPTQSNCVKINTIFCTNVDEFFARSTYKKHHRICQKCRVSLASSRAENRVRAPSIMHLIHVGRALQYLTDCVSTVSAAGSRCTLRSTDTAGYVLPRTRTKFREHDLCYCGPATWNGLPVDLCHVTDTKTGSRVYF